ncbi:MAG: molecular chaperone DnaJ [Planctomycetia bacterium]|nr:molecular chaperone DnaJ [Planctomycetia bacterium]
MRDLYDILGVDKSASKDELKRAYRKIAMKNHPDRNPDNKEAEQNFKEAAEAYAILNDEHKRAKYDQFGHAGVGMGDMGGAQGFDGVHFSMEDIFSQFGNIFGGRHPFEDIFGMGGGAQSARQGFRKAKDLRVSLKLDYSDILNGTEKTIKIKRNEICKTCDGSGAKQGTRPSQCKQCNGSGQVRQMRQSFFGQSVVVSDCPLCHGTGEFIENPCSSCDGSGIRRETVSIKVKVPKGVENGNYMTLDGQGNKGGKGIQPGDLLVFFEEQSHTYFVRNGTDIILEAHIGITQAVLGGSITVPTIEGKASLKIPKGIQSGQVLRMRGKGLPRLRSSYRGDQLIRIIVEIPVSLSKQEKNLYNELDKITESKDPTFSKMEL